MKSIKKSLVLAGLLAGVTGVASANTIEYVHIAGAPAYRQDSIAVINAVVAGFTGAGETGAYNKVLNPTLNGVDPANASAEQWYIPNFSTGVDLVISLSLTGSTASVESVASGNTALAQNFIPDTASTASLIGSPNNTGSLQITEAHVPDFALSDTYQGTTPFNGTISLRQGTTGTLHNTYTFGPLTTTTLAVEPYVWVGSPGLHTAGVSNVTTAQLQSLYENGKLPLSFFTGNSADSTKFVYGLSRDPGSGSRLIALAETGVGVTTSIKTYKPTVSGSAADSLGNFVGGTIASGAVPLYPAGVIKSTLIYDPNNGDTGYPSFGTGDQTGLLGAITATPPAGEYFIAYFNPTDAAEAVTAGAEQLTFNGQAYTPAAVQEGKYTFWSYEQLLQPSSLSSQASTIASALVTAWPTATLNTGIQLSTLNVSRSSDGGQITHN
jgi:hypothetical protein